MAAQIISIMFLSRDIAHKEHLKANGVGSYAKHMALGSFYDDVIDMADKLAETWQGRNGLMDDIPTITLKNGKNIVEKLELLMGMIEVARYKYYDKNDTPVQNIIDEIIGLYLSTLYKLRNLH